MSKNALAVLEAEFAGSLEPLSSDAQSIIYAEGWGRRKSPVIDVDPPVELDTKPVGVFTEVLLCGHKFQVEPLLGLNLNDKRLPRIVKRFAAFVEQLDNAGSIAVSNPRARKVRVFIDSDMSGLFRAILSRMTTNSMSWEFEFVESIANPAGSDVIVIVPQ